MKIYELVLILFVFKLNWFILSIWFVFVLFYFVSDFLFVGLPVYISWARDCKGSSLQRLMGSSSQIVGIQNGRFDANKPSKSTSILAYFVLSDKLYCIIEQRNISLWYVKVLKARHKRVVSIFDNFWEDILFRCRWNWKTFACRKPDSFLWNRSFEIATSVSYYFTKKLFSIS